MDVERQFEHFVDSLGNPDAPREEHRRQLRKQVLAAVESAGPSAPTAFQPRKRITIMNKSFIRWISAAAAALLLCATLVWLHLYSSPAAAWAGVSETLNRGKRCR